MTRFFNPVQYRHYHTRPWFTGGASLTILLIVGCSGASFEAGSGSFGISGEQAALGLGQHPNTAAVAPGDFAQPLTSIPSPAATLIAASRTLQARARRLVVPADPVAVDLYTLDNACEDYQIEPIQVPRLQSMETTVGLILAEQVMPDLALSGYRASYDLETKTATIDLRVARTSRRGLRSLSICEQKALLGSLRETLVNQPDWNIDAVVFTNRGNPLVL
jgi:hypothetical protein